MEYYLSLLRILSLIASENLLSSGKKNILLDTCAVPNHMICFSGNAWPLMHAYPLQLLALRSRSEERQKL